MKDLLKHLEPKPEPEKPVVLPDMMKTREVADMLRVTPRTVHRYMTDRPEHKNPLPRPCVPGEGNSSLWERKIILSWFEKEKERKNRLKNDQSGCELGGGHG